MRRILMACIALGACASMHTTSARAPMALTSSGASVGEVIIRTEGAGAALRLQLHGLPPGPHGFHLHATPSCAAITSADGAVTPAGAAGAHFDPNATHHHMGPAGDGHLGDLPLIEIGADGEANQTLHVTRLRGADAFRGHALVIHVGGDTYSDEPAPLGGGGGRLACGVVR